MSEKEKRRTTGRERIYWCSGCHAYYRCDESDYTGTCPACNVWNSQHRCSRCGHEWRSNLAFYGRTSRVCPKCKSPYWNRERVMIPERDAGKRFVAASGRAKEPRAPAVQNRAEEGDE